MKLLIVLALALAALPSLSAYKAIADDSLSSYGYMHSNIVLYSDPECKEKVTSLPATYFVTVIESYGDCHKVCYKDITGYVKEIEVVDFEPVTKYASTWFNVSNDGYPAKLRSSPSASGEIIMEIPSGKTGYYYGDVEGDELLQGYGNKWRYVSFNDGISSIRGYIYSSQVAVSEIAPNEIKKVEKPTIDKGEDLSSPSSPVDIVLIVCLCVPAVLILYLLFSNKDRSSRYGGN